MQASRFQQRTTRFLAASACILIQFVPAEARTTKIPCRHIQLTPEGETVASLYQDGTQQELEEALGNWLRATIRRIEEERAKSGEAPINSLAPI